MARITTSWRSTKKRDVSSASYHEMIPEARIFRLVVWMRVPSSDDHVCPPYRGSISVDCDGDGRLCLQRSHSDSTRFRSMFLRSVAGTEVLNTQSGTDGSVHSSMPMNLQVKPRGKWFRNQERYKKGETKACCTPTFGWLPLSPSCRESVWCNGLLFALQCRTHRRIAPVWVPSGLGSSHSRRHQVWPCLVQVWL